LIGTVFSIPIAGLLILIPLILSSILLEISTQRV